MSKQLAYRIDAAAEHELRMRRLERDVRSLTAAVELLAGGLERMGDAATAHQVRVLLGSVRDAVA